MMIKSVRKILVILFVISLSLCSIDAYAVEKGGVALDTGIALDAGASLSDNATNEETADKETADAETADAEITAEELVPIKSLVTDTGMFACVSNGNDTFENVAVQYVNGEDYLFLPANTNLNDLIFSYVPGIAVFIDNGEGMVFLAPNTGIDVESFLKATKKEGVRELNLMVVLADGRMESYKLNVLKSENIASVFIKSEDPVAKGYKFVTEINGNKTSGSLSVVNADGSVVYRGALNKIKGRGNSTWAANKKPFQIDLKTSTDLLQTGIEANKAKTWVLLANAFDPTLLRNSVSFDIAHSMGIDAPEYRHVDLYYDGVYLGSYLLCEKVEMGPGRVRINEKGYLLELDAAYYQLEDNYFLDYSSTPFVIKSPDKVSEAQKAYIENMFNEAVIGALNDGINPITGTYVWDYIDMDSLAKYYVFQELTKNPDAFISSTYFYVPEGGKIIAGPAWDFDSSYGVVKEANMNLSSALLPKDRWIGNFLRLPEFKEAVKNFMKTTGKDAAYGEMNVLNEKAALIQSSRIMNDTLWNNCDNKYYTLPTYNRNLVYLKNFINKRTSYLINNIGK